MRTRQRHRIGCVASRFVDNNHAAQMTSLPNTIADPGRARVDRQPISKRLLATRAQYLLTYGTSAVLMMCGLIAYRLASHQFSDISFAQYTLMRRSISFLVPLLMAGLAVGIAKCVAQTIAGTKNSATGVQYLTVGTLAALASAGVWIGATTLYPQQVSYLCTGSGEYAALVQSLGPMLLGLLMSACATAYLRGQMRVSTANLLRVVSLGVVPIAVLSSVNNPASFFSYCGLVVIAINALAVVAILLTNRKQTWWPTRQTASKLLSISLPRVPGDLAFYGLLVVPATLAAHRYGITTGGEVAYALSLLALAQQIVVAPSYLLLPEASALLSSGQRDRVASRVKKLLCVTTGCTLVLVMIVELFAEPLVRLHLGSSTPSVTHAIRILLPAAIPLNAAICVRGVIDAANDKPIMPRICVVALASFVLLALIPWPATWNVTPTLLAFDASVLLLGGLALRATLRALNDADRCDSNKVDPATSL